MSTTTPKKMGVAEEVKAAVTHATVPSKMTAAVLYGSEDLRIEKIDVPALAADEVLVRVRLALTDGTDLKVWKRGYHAKMIQPPAVFGHELVGRNRRRGQTCGSPLAHRRARDCRELCALSALLIIAAAARKIFATTSCSTTEPTPTTCASPAASSSKICWEVPQLCRRSERRARRAPCLRASRNPRDGSADRRYRGGNRLRPHRG